MSALLMAEAHMVFALPGENFTPHNDWVRVNATYK